MRTSSQIAYGLMVARIMRTPQPKQAVPAARPVIRSRQEVAGQVERLQAARRVLWFDREVSQQIDAQICALRRERIARCTPPQHMAIELVRQWLRTESAPAPAAEWEVLAERARQIFAGTPLLAAAA